LRKEHKDNGRLRWFIGDIREYGRIVRALQGVDYLIHAAALKQIFTGQYNPLEVIRTNVEGTENVMQACVDSAVQRAVFLSSDNAVYPLNLYGATKLCGERLWLGGNVYRGCFNVVRYGNVMGSRGSVIEKYRALKTINSVEYPVYDVKMTRFWMTPLQAVELALNALAEPPQTLLVGKCPSFRVADLAKAFYLRAQLKEEGRQPGEKIHETLLTEFEAQRGYEYKDYYQILPEIKTDDKAKYFTEKGMQMEPKAITSADNPVTLNELRGLLEAL